MRRGLLILMAIAAVVLATATAVLIFNEPTPPPELTSVTHALDAVDFSTLPDKRPFKARDATVLLFRAYAGKGNDTVILVHGATLTSASMHVVAQALQARGASVFALDLRGHDGGGRRGDVDYIGQLTDDIADFVQTLPSRKPGERRGLVGFSAGGGLALTFAGSPSGRAFERFVFVSPALAYNAPTARPGFGGWVNAAMPRILVLLALDQVGIATFNGLPTSAFAAPPGSRHATTPLYTFRMAASFGASPRFLDDLRSAHGKVALVAGGADEVFFADRYEPLLRPVRPDLDITVLPGLNHMDMIIKPEAVALIADKALSP